MPDSARAGDHQSAIDFGKTGLDIVRKLQTSDPKNGLLLSNYGTMASSYAVDLCAVGRKTERYEAF